MRSDVAKRTVFSSALLVAGVFVVVLVVGAVLQSGPSQATIGADRQPTSTTTTEPPPEGVTIVFIDNGVLRPSNLEIDTTAIQVVKWINRDDREFILEESNGLFVSEPLGVGDEFEYDFSTQPNGLYRYKAILVTDSLFGGVRIPGLVDTRAAQ